ncbi:MAG: LpxI family protein [Planctomycetota bacterium]|jgi:DUF1009 family protein
MSDSEVLGLIAGGGRLPFLVAGGAKRCGLRVICVSLGRSADASLANEVDRFYRAGLARPGSWIRKLKKHGVTNAIMVGRVAKSRLYTPWRIVRYLPDWRALRVYYWRLRGKPKLSPGLLRALADELASGGLELEDSTTYCKEHLATEGLMTSGSGGGTGDADIEFGWEMVKRIADLGIGQAIAVREQEVIAVEALEGTASMIERAGQLCTKGKWTLFKASKGDQDMRLDVPCVGPDTIKGLVKNGCRRLVVEAGKTIIIDKPETIELANKLGVTIIGR